MQRFKPGDWIKNRKGKTSYRVIRVRLNGHLIVQDRYRIQRDLTRPEEYRLIPAPDDGGEWPNPLCTVL